MLRPVRASAHPLAVGLLALALLVPAPVVAQPSACAAPVDARQAELDNAGVAVAAAAGLELDVIRQCSGFSVVVQREVDPQLAQAYAASAESAYNRLASETGQTLSPRAVLFIFIDQPTMLRGERVIGGPPRLTGEPRAGYTWANTVWLDDSSFGSASRRAQAVAHEFSHLFTAAVAHGDQQVPSWFNEGLAVHSEMALTADQFPDAAQADAVGERAYVLDALAEDADVPLFGLDELADNRAWLERFADPDQTRLQYAQAFETVVASMDGRGRASSWEVLREMGRGADFAAAFTRVYGRSPRAVDAAARDAWQAQLDAAPDPLRLSVQLAPGDADLDIAFGAGRSLANYSGSASGSYTFEVGGDNAVTEVSGAPLERFGEPNLAVGDVSVELIIVRGDGTVEIANFDRSYGQWQPSERKIRNTSVGLPLTGVGSPTFPSGDAVHAEFPARVP